MGIRDLEKLGRDLVAAVERGDTDESDVVLAQFCVAVAVSVATSLEAIASTVHGTNRFATGAEGHEMWTNPGRP